LADYGHELRSMDYAVRAFAAANVSEFLCEWSRHDA
jgi:hypothetical protein